MNLKTSYAFQIGVHIPGQDKDAPCAVLLMGGFDTRTAAEAVIDKFYHADKDGWQELALRLFGAPFRVVFVDDVIYEVARQGRMERICKE